MTSTLPPLVQAVAGGVGSVVANAGTYPLDLVLTRIQTQRADPTISDKKKPDAREIIRDIIRNDGYRGLYAGILPDSLATLVSNFFYFYVYSFLRKRLLAGRTAAANNLKRIPSPTPWPYPPPKRGAPALGTFEELAVGFIAGVISRLVSSPLNIVTVRLQLEKEVYEKDPEDNHGHDHRLINLIKRIHREEGLRGFWKGFESTMALCLNPAITLFFFQIFRRIFLFGKYREVPTARQAFIIGAGSNAIAVALLYPFILAKTRLQAARKRYDDASLQSVLEEVVDHKGWKGLYDGLDVQLVKGVLSQGFTFMAKQRIESFIIGLYLFYRKSK